MEQQGRAPLWAAGAGHRSHPAGAARLQVKEETTSTSRRESRQEQEAAESWQSPLPLCSLSSGSAGDYSRAPSHTKINKQFICSPGNFATLNKSLQSQLWLHFTLTSSLTVPSFQDQLEARAKRKTNKKHSHSHTHTKTNQKTGKKLKSKVKLSSPASPHHSPEANVEIQGLTDNTLGHLVYTCFLTPLVLGTDQQDSSLIQESRRI